MIYLIVFSLMAIKEEPLFLQNQLGYPEGAKVKTLGSLTPLYYKDTTLSKSSINKQSFSDRIYGAFSLNIISIPKPDPSDAISAHDFIPKGKCKFISGNIYLPWKERFKVSIGINWYQRIYFIIPIMQPLSYPFIQFWELTTGPEYFLNFQKVKFGINGKLIISGAYELELKTWKEVDGYYFYPVSFGLSGESRIIFPLWKIISCNITFGLKHYHLYGWTVGNIYMGIGISLKRKKGGEK